MECAALGTMEPWLVGDDADWDPEREMMMSAESGEGGCEEGEEEEAVLRKPHEKTDIVIPSRFDGLLLSGQRPPKRDFVKIYSEESRVYKPLTFYHKNGVAQDAEEDEVGEERAPEELMRSAARREEADLDALTRTRSLPMNGFEFAARKALEPAEVSRERGPPRRGLFSRVRWESRLGDDEAPVVERDKLRRLARLWRHRREKSPYNEHDRLGED